MTRTSGAPRGPILVVDDDDIILESLGNLLTDEGYSVITAANGAEALVCAAEQRPCLILLDMKMPVMDGWAFAEAYRQQSGRHAPVVVMTAAQDSRARAAEIGADDYIAKPFDVERLLAVVRRHVPPSH